MAKHNRSHKVRRRRIWVRNVGDPINQSSPAYRWWERFASIPEAVGQTKKG